MKEKPVYYAILTADVRYDEELNDFTKILFSEVTALMHKDGYCYASNQHFQDLYGKSESTISRAINKLVKKGYLRSEMIYKKGTKEIEQRRLYREIKIETTYTAPYSQKRLDPIGKNDYTYSQKCREGYSQKCLDPIGKNDKDITTSIITTSIINKEKTSKKNFYFDNPQVEELFHEFLELRKSLKAKNTERAVSLLKNKLDKWGDLTKIQMLEDAISHSWKSVYEPKNGKGKKMNGATTDNQGVKRDTLGYEIL